MHVSAGEEETDCNLLQLISKGEVAWWDGTGQAPGESAAASHGALYAHHICAACAIASVVNLHELSALMQSCAPAFGSGLQRMRGCS